MPTDMDPHGHVDGEVARDERKIVTALFADVAGSTALGAQLDPEEFRLVMADAVARMCAVVDQFGGQVKEIAGDGVLALFGAPAVHEDDAERAVRAALGIVESIADYGTELKGAWGIEEFGVRIGVCTGLAVLGVVGGDTASDYTAYGDGVNTAARLQRLAAPGLVLVDSTTKRLTETVFAWSDGEVQTIEGKEEPLTTFEVTGFHDESSSDDSTALRSGLVGRDHERSELEAAARSLEGGLGRILFITGEAGIGKSRLVEELRNLTGGSATWLEGHSASWGESTPYWPFRDLLRNWLGVTSDEADLRVRVGLRKEIDRLFPGRPMEIYPYLAAMLALGLEPDARARLSGLSPEALQYRTFEVIKELVTKLAESGPVVLTIEDLHWSDPTSVQLLETLFGLAERAPILFVVTARSDPDHHSWEIRSDAEREYPHTTTEVSLDALTGDAGADMLHALVGLGTLPAEVEEAVLAVAEGNPFYLEELVRSLVDAGAIVRDDDGWRFDHAVEVELPATVELVILARIDRLDETTHRVILGASVLGRQFSLPVLAAVTDETDDTLQTALHQLQRLDFVRQSRRLPEPEYRFKHALIQEAAYRTLLKADRVTWHERAARFLEDRYVDNRDEVLGLLAHHWHAAEVEDKAVGYLTLAADKARHEYALDEAIDHYRALLPLLEKRGDRRSAALALFRLVLALHMSLRFAEANGAYQRGFDYWDEPDSREGEATALLRLPGSPGSRPDIKSHYLGEIQLCMALYDRLVEAWPERTIVPSLAHRWNISDDGLRYTFHLRDRLTWDDGTPLTAHDVEYGIKRILDPEAPGMSVAIYFVLEEAKGYYLGDHTDPDRIGVSALDDLTVEFRLTAPAPYFMWVVNRPDGGPQPRHAIEAGHDPFEIASVSSSGAFRIADHSDDLIALERRPGDKRPRPGNVGRVEYSLDRSRVEEGYREGTLDLAESRFAYLPELDRTSSEEGSLWPPAWCAFIQFDHSHPFVGNVDVRRALAHCIDRGTLKSLMPPSWVFATGGIVPPPLQGHTPDIAPVFDPERAKQLLETADVEAVRLKLESLYPTEHESAVVGNVVAGWREHLGLDIEIEESEPDLRAEDESAADFPIMLGGWYPGYPDPEYYLRLLLQSDSHSNIGGFAHDGFDELVERARQERSDRRRLELFHQADRLAISDQVAAIPLWYASNHTFVRPYVDGWWEFGKTWPNFANLVIRDH